MSEALYRKYRSRRLSDVVGQDHITKSLQNALKAGRISHAYLLTGPRGVGKTSIARILAHEINKLPYADDQPHLDIIEIDAASNRRIDEIRDLREKVHIAPTSAKYKVYIIDEVHMLTKEAFNALLKTLEEPPDHVIFILATTEAHKLPETIISRTQRYTFRPIDIASAVQHLRNIANKENIDIDEDAIKLIAEHGTGSFRDSISILDQLSSGAKKITEKQVLSMLGVVPDSMINQLAHDIYKAEPKKILDNLEELRLKGYTAGQIATQLIAHYRKELVEGRSDKLSLQRKLLDVPASYEPDRLLELLLLGENFNTNNRVKVLSADKPETSKALPEDQTGKKNRPSSSKSHLDEDVWNQVLAEIKNQHNTLYSFLRMAEPNLRNNTLTLSFRFPFHYRRINEPRNLEAVKIVVHKNIGESVKINCELNEEVEDESKTQKSKPVETISNIFGSAELLE